MNTNIKGNFKICISVPLNKLLRRLLEKESEVAIKWFSDNSMIVNPKKFQAIIINRPNRSNHNCSLTINNAEINSKE